MATAKEAENSESDSESEVGDLMALGPDAWDDTELIAAFENDVKSYKKSHKKQLKNACDIETNILSEFKLKPEESITNKQKSMKQNQKYFLPFFFLLFDFIFLIFFSMFL